MRQSQREFIAVDQYGDVHKGLGAYPRKALLERLGRKHASKMYIGDGIHIGYVIGGLWLRLYQVLPFERCGKPWIDNFNARCNQRRALQRAKGVRK